MWRSDAQVIVAAIVFVILLGMTGVAASYPYEARLVPLVIGLPATVLAAWQLAVEARRVGRAVEPAVPGDAAAVPDTPADRRDARAEAVAILWMLGITVIVLLGGLVTGGTIGVVLAQRVWLRESWRTALAGGLVAFVVLRVCFERGFGLLLFEGWIVEWLAR